MKLLRDVAMSLLNTPYRWGGKVPATGLDCSGLVQVILNAAGEDLPGDQNAQAYFDHFSRMSNHRSQEPQLGALVFYGGGPRDIDHVAFALTSNRHIEAAGGGPRILSLADASAARAYARVTKIRSTKLVGIFVPDYDSCDLS